MAAQRLVVYGVPLSPPFRSVVWTLLQKRQPFKIQITVPGATTKIGSLNESFLSKTRGRTGIVPVLEDGSTISLSESPAILAFLCESRPSSPDLYGKPGTVRKAHIDEYMHWHHTNTKKLSALTIPFLRPDLAGAYSKAEPEETARKVLQSLDQAWLKNRSYIASTEEDDERPSIADMLAYEEVVQATMLLDSAVVDLAEYPSLKAWTQRMESLPFHDAAHEALKVLGSMKIKADDEDMMKRLGMATKEGMKALHDAQASF